MTDGTDDRKAAWFCDGADKDFGVFHGTSCFWVEKHSGQNQSSDDCAVDDIFFDDSTHIS